jgi:hypothetical protein
MWRGDVAHALVRAVSRLFSTPWSGVDSVSGPGVAMSGDAARMSVAIAFRITMVMKMVSIVAAVEVVARTGYGEAVRVFDLGPRNETMSRGPGDRRWENL